MDGGKIMANSAIQGTNESEFLKGTLEDDWIRGLAGDDTIYGYAGNDTLIGDDENDPSSIGNDSINGGDGDDFIAGHGGNDTLRGGLGNDRLYGHADDDILYGDGGNDKLYGNTGNDTLYGGGGNDIFYYYSGDGNDVIGDYQNNAKAKNVDMLWIDDAAVKKAAVSGSDVVFTVGSGTVTLKNAAAKSVALKDTRGDYTMSKTGLTLSSNFGGTMFAAQYLSTVKTINGKSAKKTIKLYGNAQANTIAGGKAADYLDGGAGNDTLAGGAGNDTFAYKASTGKDVITDYATGDLFYVTSGTISKTALANKNKDLVFTVGKGTVTMKNAATKSSVKLKDSRGNYTMTKSGLSLSSNFKGALNSAYYLATITSINGSSTTNAVTLYGNAKNNTINGGKVADKLYGRAGKDKILGNAGNDTLYGEAGNDSLYGGAGNDYLSGGANNDYLDGGANNDKLYGGAGDDRLLGNAGVDYLYGEAGSDNLNGGAGADYLYGGAGNDILTGGAGNDTFVFAKSTGKDVVTDYNKSGTDTLYISSGSISKVAVSGSNMVFTVGSGTITLNGAAAKTITVKDSRGSYTLNKTTLALTNASKGSFNAVTYLATLTTINGTNATKVVTLYGNTKNNTINGGSANDELYGRAGHDKISGNNWNDSLYGEAGNDKLYGGTGDDYLSGGADNDYLNGGAGDDYLYGGDGADTLYAGAGTDYLYGGTGDDILYANAGISYLYGEGGVDTFVVDANTNQNVYIYDFMAGTDKLKVLNSSNVTAKVVGNNVVLTMGKSTVTLKGAAKSKNYIGIYNASGARVAGIRLSSDTQQSVIKNFMTILDSTAISLMNRNININNDEKYLDEGIVNVLNEAVRYASNGLFWTWSELLYGTRFNGIITALSKFKGTAENFLLNYCGIVLNNDDTGAITGKDAGGSVNAKNKDNIIQENSQTIKSVPANNSTTTIAGLTFHWKYTKGTTTEYTIAQYIRSWWAEQGLKLIADSYGLDFQNATVKNINVEFDYSNEHPDWVAWVTNYGNKKTNYRTTGELELTINMNYYSKFESSNYNGVNPDKPNNYLDRILAHELTHAVMAANIDYFNYLPSYIKEGAAELVHGIDDWRDLKAVVKSVSDLTNALKNCYKASNANYSGGYLLLRFLAKQVEAANKNGITWSWGSSSGCAPSEFASFETATSSSAQILTNSSAMLVGTSTAQLSSLISETATSSVGSLTTSKTGLVSVDASGSNLVAANDVGSNNVLTNKNKVA